MKGVLMGCVAIPFYLAVIYAFWCFLRTAFSPLYQRICQMVSASGDVEVVYWDDGESLKELHKKARWLTTLEILRAIVKYGIIAALSALIFPPTAPLVFLFLAGMRWQKWKLIAPFDPEGWHKNLFRGLYTILFAAIWVGVGMGAIYLAYGSI